MPFPIIPVVATAATAGLGLLLFGGGKKAAPTPAPTPSPVPKAAPKVVIPEPTKPSGLDLPTLPKAGPIPIPIPPGPSPIPSIPTIPAGMAIAKVTAPSGLNVRDQPNVGGRQLTLLPLGTMVLVVDPTNRLPATNGAPQGWFKIRTSGGMEGFSSAEYLQIQGVAPMPPAPIPIPNVIPQIPPAPSPVPIPAPVPVPIPGLPGVGTVSAKSGLNIRSAPNTTGKVLTTAPYGTPLVIDSTAGVYPATPEAPKGWYKVSTPTAVTGYASVEFINTAGAPPGPAPLPSPIPNIQPVNLNLMTATVTAKSGLNVRSAPNTTGKVLATMPYGSKLVINDMTYYPPTAGAPQGWMNVVTSTGIKGYASKEFLNVESSIVPNITSTTKVAGDFGFDISDDEIFGKGKYSLRG